MSSATLAFGAPESTQGERGVHSNRMEHVVQFYEHDTFLVETVATFVADGLSAGQPAIAVVTAPRREALAKRLAEIGMDVAGRVASGDLVIFDVDETLAKLMVGDAPSRALFEAHVPALLGAVAARSATGHVRVYGEMVDQLWRAGNAAAAIALEELWNELGARYQISLLCGYRMENFRHQGDAAGFDAVCRSHARALPTEAYLGLDDSDSRLRAVSALQQRAKALESEVAQRQIVENELRDAIKVRDDFLAAAGHELRTPLTVMRLQLASLSRQTGDGDPRTQARLSMLAAQTERLARVTERLLDVANLGDQLGLQLRTVDLGVLVRNGVKALAGLATASGCSVTVTGDGAAIGHWDSDRLEQAVGELLANAFKFGPTTPVRIAVHARAEHAELTICDGGIGIAPEDHGNIFDRCARRAPIENFGGLGLGLWIVRRIVEAHGGSVTVQSAVSLGATFTVRLPYAPPAADARATLRAPELGQKVNK